MNHIFYKLANDAWIDAPDGGGYAGKIFSKEKFAELIVRECVEVCNGQATYDPQTLPYKPSKQFADAIKEHFGVEE